MRKIKPEITQALISEAKKNPNGWVYHVDTVYPAGHHVPPQAIVGAWKVDANGDLTDEFKFNEKHVPIVTASREPRKYMSRGLDLSDANLWIVEIDPKFDDMFPDIPVEGKIGSWYVGEDGKFTGQFRPNPHYKGKIKT